MWRKCLRLISCPEASYAELALAHLLGPHLSLWLPAMKEDLKVEDGNLAKRINYSLIEWEVCLSWLPKWLDIMACAYSPSTQEVRQEG